MKNIPTKVKQINVESPTPFNKGVIIAIEHFLILIFKSSFTQSLTKVIKIKQ